MVRLFRIFLTGWLLINAFSCLLWAQDMRGEAPIIGLEEAIREALERNPRMKEVIRKELYALEDKSSARKDLLFKLSSTYSYTKLKDEPYSTFPMSTSLNMLIDKLNAIPGGVPIPHVSDRFPVSDRERFSWDFTLTQPIFTGLALLNKKRIAELGADVAAYERELVSIELARQVRVAYMNILLAKRALEVSEDEFRQLGAHLRDAEKFFEQGVVARNDLLKSEVALLNAEQKRTRACSDLKLAVAHLNLLLARDINADTQILEIEPEPGKYMDLECLNEAALSKRPEISILKASLEQAGLSIKIARAGHLPQIYLVAQYQRMGDNPSVSNNDFGNDHNASVSVQARLSIFEWGKVQNEIRKAGHQQGVLEEKLRGLKDGILMEVKQAYENLKVAEATIETARAARQQARENYRITNLQYQEGITTSTEVLDARAYLTQAENNYFKALYGFKLAEADLLKAIGER